MEKCPYYPGVRIKWAFRKTSRTHVSSIQRLNNKRHFYGNKKFLNVLAVTLTSQTKESLRSFIIVSGKSYFIVLETRRRRRTEVASASASEQRLMLIAASILTSKRKMKTTSNDLQQKATEVKLLCMHSRQKTLFNDYDTRVKQKKKGRHVTFHAILLLLFRKKLC